MAQYPNPNQGMGNGGQQPWGGYGMPQSQNHYGAALPPQAQQNVYGYGTPASYQYPAPYSATPYQQAPLANSQMTMTARRPFVLALLAFPFQCLKVFVLPAPMTFAREKDQVGWGLIWTLLLGLAVISGLLALAWGRMSRLTLAVQTLSLGRVMPQPFAPGLCLGVALGAPLLFLLLAGVMHKFAKKLGGRGSYRAQSYTALLITLPFALLVGVAALALIAVPALSSSLHFVFGLVVLGFFLYGILLHIFAVMAVQGLGAGKATLVVLGMAVILLVIIAIMALMVMAFDGDFSSGGGSSSSHGGSSHSKSSNANQGAVAASAGAAYAPQQGQAGHGGASSEHKSFFDDLDFDGENHGGHPGVSGLVIMRCPACGMALSVPHYQAQMGATCPRCGMPMMA